MFPCIYFAGTASGDKCSPDYVPTLNLGYKTSTISASSQIRYERVLKRDSAKKSHIHGNGKSIADALPSYSPDFCDSIDDPFQVIDSLTIACDDPIEEAENNEHCLTTVERLEEKLERLTLELNSLREERDCLKQQLKSSKFSFYVVNTDEKVRFYTGLPSLACFTWLLEFVSSVLPTSAVLDSKDILLLIFMKLRLNLLNQDLAFRFQISKGTVSNILHAGLPSIASKVAGFIHWPNKGDVLRTLPKVFKKSYPRCRVIIDCTEIFIDRPGNLEAKQLTWSNYKHNNTLKVLIGISPTGAIIFVSRAYGGRVSDKVITQRSGFLDLLEYGDQVLADRGFLVGDDIAAHNASLIIPSFTKGKNQLSQRDVEISRRISRFRIHVERAIGRIKNFRILSTPMQLNMVPNFDNIMTICSAITNLHPKLVK